MPTSRRRLSWKPLVLALTLSLLASAQGSARAEESHPVTLQRNVKVRMRDGATLSADVYQPADAAKYPVLLQRTPYDKNLQADVGIRFATRGYIVVIEDVRGRFASEGEWYPFKHESDDGYDTVEWAAALARSDGRVGMFGESYVGATQVLAAIAHPPHLAGIAPSDTTSNFHDGWVYQGGAFELGFNESWTTILAGNTIARSLPGAADFPGATRTVPLSAFPLFAEAKIPPVARWTQQYAPYYEDWLAHPDFDSFWRAWSIEDHYPEMQVPALSISAWYDIFEGGSLRNYIGLKSQGGTAKARSGQRLVVAIGGHAGSGRKIGAVDFGPAAEEWDEEAATLTWFDFLLKGARNQWAGPKPVRLFVMGANQWRDEEDWPLQRAQTTRYFLHSAGKANSSRGDGSLAPTPPSALETADTYLYRPENPVPTVGGPLCCEGRHFAGGPFDQRDVELRDDVLVYSTAPFGRDTEFTGPVTLELYARSSARDTDFTAKLVDVWPDGFVQNLTEGVLRARYRESQTSPSPLQPGQTYKLKIDLWATSNVFKTGHRLRLEVSSSNFPRFDRNPNTGEPVSSGGSRPVSASNTVLHDAEHPSALVLPLIP